MFTRLRAFASKALSVITRTEVMCGLAAFIAQMLCAWGLNRLWPGNLLRDLGVLYAVTGTLCLVAGYLVWNKRTEGCGDENMGEGFLKLIIAFFYYKAGVVLLVPYVFGGMLAVQKNWLAEPIVFSVGAFLFALFTAWTAGSMTEHDETADAYA